jgi:hypothetical protein
MKPKKLTVTHKFSCSFTALPFAVGRSYLLFAPGQEKIFFLPFLAGNVNTITMNLQKIKSMGWRTALPTWAGNGLMNFGYRGEKFRMR